MSAIHAFGLELSHSDVLPSLQLRQVPHEIVNGTSSRSPRLTFFTALPTSTISPMNSCPNTSPFITVGTKPEYMCKSEPQIAVEVTRTIASYGVRIVGSG